MYITLTLGDTPQFQKRVGDDCRLVTQIKSSQILKKN
ncbi:hypothetical protein Phi14:2_gp125 [Cellulophaga phage phi14:2]|uniref:Uncharacterized protein n=1 Tax=Cellulophaga phage phi14:2 TaxID=1327990 RepID=S0A447_9CAUD|nr:hypothetical protein Phi14:2_gp125 [Cellulophaga phage phi14:2]